MLYCSFFLNTLPLTIFFLYKAVFLKERRRKFLGGNFTIANGNHCLNYLFFVLQYFVLGNKERIEVKNSLQIDKLSRMAKRAKLVLECCQLCSKLCAYHINKPMRAKIERDVSKKQAIRWQNFLK